MRIWPQTINRLLWLNAIGFFFIVVLHLVEGFLLEQDLLNKKDIGFVGGETGCVYEYLTNIWYWDAAIFVATIIVAIFCVCSVFGYFAHRHSG